MNIRNQAGLVVAVLVASGWVACGKATSPDEPGVPGDDAGTPEDAGANGRIDAGFDAGALDAGGFDAGAFDAGTVDAGFDAGVDAGHDAGTSYHPVGWTDPDGGAFHGAPALQGLLACAACHGPELTGGTVGVSCDQCHSGWKTNCTFCHGGVDNQTGAPPRDILGRTATTEVTVGAHSSHVSATHALASPLTCAACHPAVTNALTAGHVDPGPAELTLTGWVRASASCAVYCHGGFDGGTASNVPSWTQVTGLQAACGTCHALAPATGRHPNREPAHAFMGSNCSFCHLDANATATAITRPDLHVNGVNDVAPTGGTWNATTRTCSPACHATQSW